MKNNNETKQKLIDVTRHMIDTNGIDAVSMRDLGKEMNLSRSAVYRHFKSKDDLLAAIAIENFETMKRYVTDLNEQIEDSRELIYNILYTFYDYCIKHQDHYQLMFRKQWNKDQNSDLHAPAFEAYKIFEKCLVKAQEQKYVLNKSPKQLTAIISAFIVGLVDLNSAGHIESEKGLDNPNILINSFLDVILR